MRRESPSDGGLLMPKPRHHHITHRGYNIIVIADGKGWSVSSYSPDRWSGWWGGTLPTLEDAFAAARRAVDDYLDEPIEEVIERLAHEYP